MGLSQNRATPNKSSIFFFGILDDEPSSELGDTPFMETLIQVSLRFITVIYETSIYIWQNHWENDDIYIYTDWWCNNHIEK